MKALLHAARFAAGLATFACLVFILAGMKSALTVSALVAVVACMVAIMLDPYSYRG